VDDAMDWHAANAHGVCDLHFVDQITYKWGDNKNNEQSDVEQSFSDPLLL
jgi:hypothetical protein